MTEEQFAEILARKERAEVDFKLECHAFTGSDGANGELAKDICALANNGNKPSFLIIGVSDDGEHFRSVTNTKLTDDNLQSFCKTAVLPPPRVRLFRERWGTPGKAYSGVEFVFIQVGPQRRQAFRLGKDFIDWKGEKCYRRNEVWLRREATSDLATPEETALLAAGKDPASRVADDGTVYTRLPRVDQSTAIINDLATLAPRLGAATAIDAFGNPHRLVVNVAGKPVVLRVVIALDCTDRLSGWWHARNEWQYEHGILLLSPRTIPKRALPNYQTVDSTERWGRFVYRDRGLGHDLPGAAWPVPSNSGSDPFLLLEVPSVQSRAGLARALGCLVSSLREDVALQAKVLECRAAWDCNIAGWLKQGWFFETREYFVTHNDRQGFAAQLPDGRIADQPPQWAQAAEGVLLLSKQAPPVLPAP